MKHSERPDAHEVRMIDVGSKPVTVRTATASGTVRLAEKALRAVADGTCPKGDVITVARVAGIQAAKRTSEIIPLCHPLPIHSIDVAIHLKDGLISIECTARAEARTGVEMEALTGVCAAALTVIDMTKSISPDGSIEHMRLEQKSGGVHGDYRRGE